MRRTGIWKFKRAGACRSQLQPRRPPSHHPNPSHLQFCTHAHAHDHTIDGVQKLHCARFRSGSVADSKCKRLSQPISEFANYLNVVEFASIFHVLQTDATAAPAAAFPFTPASAATRAALSSLRMKAIILLTAEI